MERSPMFADCENGHTTKSNLHVQCNPYQNSNHILHRNRKIILKYIWKQKRPRRAKAILSKKSNARSITIPNFKLYYRVITIKTARNWNKIDHWIRIEDSDINLRSYSQLIFDKELQSTWWRKDSLFNICCWENWMSTCTRLKLDPCLLPYTKINSKVD
jgi:hypothetical protein